MDNISAEAIFEATVFADVALLKRYIREGRDADISSDNGNNLLWHIASNSVPEKTLRCQLIEMATLLIDNNVSPIKHNDFGINAVYEAVYSGFFELCKLFTHHGITLTAHISLNEFIYRWPRHPSRQQRIDFPKVLNLLLLEKPDLALRLADYKHYTPLQLACIDGKTQAIVQLLDAGAVSNGNINANQADQGAELMPNNDFATQPTPIEQLCNYAWRSRQECFVGISALLDGGATPNLYSNDTTRPNDSKPALIWAVIYGGNSLRVVEHLLQAGANVHLKDASGHDAFYWAKQSKRDDLVCLLKQYSEGEV